MDERDHGCMKRSVVAETGQRDANTCSVAYMAIQN